MTSISPRLAGCSLLVNPWQPGTCRWCPAELTGRRTRWCSDECARAYENNHYWQFARKAALKRDERRCVRCSADWKADLEVNHIVPILGHHSESGCHHHLDNLETLCRPCHLTVTAEQRAQGLLNRNAS